MYRFSIVIPFSNDELYISDSINSIINQTINFKDEVQLILVDEGSFDESHDIISHFKQKYPDNILVIAKDEFSLDNIEGEYVNFFNVKRVFDDNAFYEVMKCFDKSNIVSINAEETKNGIINVFEEYDYPLSDVHSCFVNKNILKNNNLDSCGLNKLLLDEKEYCIVNSTGFESLEEMEYNKEFFTERPHTFHLNLMEYSKEKIGFIPDFIKFTVACDLINYYNVSTSDKLNKREYLEFHKTLRRVLDHIDDKFICDNRFIGQSTESFFMYLKNNEFHIETQKDNVLLKSNDYLLNSLKDSQIIIDIVEVIGGVLNLSLWFRSNCDYDYLKIQAIRKTKGSYETYDGKFFSYPTTNRFPKENLGYCWIYDYSCDFSIPLSDFEESEIEFRLIYDENGNHVEIKNPLQFQNYDAGLSKVSNYLIKDNRMVIYDGKTESIRIQPYSFATSLKLDFISILKMIKDCNSSTLPAIFYHLLYLFTYPFMRNRRIWLFQDRVDLADDNAKHLFEYAVRQDDDIEKYFVISRDCEDFDKMKEIDENIVPLGSFKNKFLYLFAEKMISSHVNHSWLNPFFNPKRPYYNGLLTVEKCFLQHGVIKDDLSSWFRKYFQNLHLFLTSSDYERDSIMSETYNYSSSVVQAFGLPRHDNLKFGQSKRQILFTPTWRKNLLNRAMFEKSDYFRRLNGLLNNEKLLKYLKDNDFKLIFRPHYDLLPFMDLFNIPEGVEVNTKDSYQELFNNSAVLITDYSSVFFDFAFLKKPVIYYHEGDDYHYQKGYFDYGTMGFGEIVQSQEALVDRLIEYIENDCQMEDKYKRRVDGFFKYTDQKNCKRVYEWLQNH